jgi:hypothetical protein
MTTFPTPTGGSPDPFTGAGTGTVGPGSTVAQIAFWLTSTGQGDGAAYQVWANAAIAKDRALTPAQAYAIWATGTGVSAALGAAATGTATATGEAATGAAAGANQVAKALNPITSWAAGIEAIGAFFEKLGSPALWIRVAEVAVGVILLAAGIAKMTNAIPVATKIAKAVA